MAAKQDNPGAKSLKKHFSDLSEAVQHPLGLAAKLYSADIIDQSILDQVSESPKTKQEKNVLLLKAVSSQVSQKPEVFERFLEILKKESYLDHITTTMALDACRIFTSQNQSTTRTDREPSQMKQDTCSSKPKGKRVKTVPKELKLRWRMGPAVPNGEYMSRGAAAVHGATAYFNSAGSSMVYEYCSKRNQWLNKIKCPRTDFGLEVVTGILTLIGGKPTSKEEEVTNTLLSLPLGEKNWSETFPRMPTKRMKPETACIAQYVAVVGGKEIKSSYHLNCVEVMDIETRQWHVCDSIPNMSNIRWMTMAASDDTLYVSGRACDRYFLCTCSIQALLQSSDAKRGAIKAYPWQELQRPHVITSDCIYTLTALNGQLMAAGCEHIKAVTVREDEYEREQEDEYGPYGYDDYMCDDDYDEPAYFPPVHCYVYIYNSRSWIKLSDSVDEVEPHNPLFVAVSGDKLILVSGSSYVKYTNVAMN